jgi:hypothetical protein
MTARSAVWFLVVCAGGAAPLSAQASVCDDPYPSPQAKVTQQQWENQSPVYADATELARALNERGFVVECIRSSVEERLFKGQKGAAWFKTDRGIFEVWFLPKPQNFAGLEIIDQQKNGEYVSSFRGTPRVSVTMAGSKPSYFIKYRSALFHVIGDEELAASIKNAFQEP